MLRIWRSCPRPLTIARFALPAGYKTSICCAAQARYSQASSRDASNAGSRATWSEARSPSLSDAQRQTIYALATASGPAGIAVVRISGPRVRDVRAHMVRPTHRRLDKEPVPWKLERCTVVDPQTKEVLDDALAVFFPGT